MWGQVVCFILLVFFVFRNVSNIMSLPRLRVKGRNQKGLAWNPNQVIWHPSCSFFFFYFFNFTILYWFCHISTWIHHRYTCVPHPEPPSLLPPHSIPLGRPSAPAPSVQYHASNLDWRLLSYMIFYMFQCHSPKSSHPLSLPQSPKDCSIHQCLFCCLVHSIVTILLPSFYCYHLSKFHIYALVYCIGVFLSGLLHSV